MPRQVYLERPDEAQITPELTAEEIAKELQRHRDNWTKRLRGAIKQLVEVLQIVFPLVPDQAAKTVPNTTTMGSKSSPRRLRLL